MVIKKLKFITSILYGKINKALLIISFFMLIGMILEFVGLGVVFPLIMSLIEPNQLLKYDLIERIYDSLDLTSPSQLTHMFLFIIIIIYVIKTAFMAYFTYKQNIIIAKIVSKISYNLYSLYLNQPFSFHIKNNSSTLIKNIQIEVNYISSYLMCALEIIINLAIIFSIIVTLILVEPIGAISIALYFILTALLYYQIIKPFIKKWGEKRSLVVESMSKTLIEGIQSIRELILFSAINIYTKKFINLNKEYAIVTAKNNTSQQLPRLFFELAAIFGILMFVFILILKEDTSSNLLTILGVFTAAVFRVIPSINKAVYSLQNLKFYTPSVELIFKELKELNLNVDSNQTKKFIFQKEINFNKVYFKYEPNSNWVLENINLTIKKGDSIGLKGESGVGKSTLIDLLAGIYKPNDGKIIIDGKDICFDKSTTKRWMKNIGYVPQNVLLIDDTIKNNITLGEEPNEINQIQMNVAIEKAGLRKFIDSLSNGLNTVVGEGGTKLSGGQRQRVGIARALYSDPSIIIFDEATSALDDRTQNEVIKSIIQFFGKKTVIIISHRISSLEVCKKIYEIKNKKLLKVC